MPLANLYNIPGDDEGLLVWGFQNAAEHEEIIALIKTKRNRTLDSYVLDPIPVFDLQSWLRRHQTMHNDANAVLGIAGNDLSTVDIENPEQFTAWIGLHADEHAQMRRALGV